MCFKTTGLFFVIHYVTSLFQHFTGSCLFVFVFAQYGWSPLIYAVYLNRREIARLLVDCGAATNVKSYVSSLFGCCLLYF